MFITSKREPATNWSSSSSDRKVCSPLSSSHCKVACFLMEAGELCVFFLLFPCRPRRLFLLQLNLTGNIERHTHTLLALSAGGFFAAIRTWALVLFSTCERVISAGARSIVLWPTTSNASLVRLAHFLSNNSTTTFDFRLPMIDWANNSLFLVLSLRAAYINKCAWLISLGPSEQTNQWTRASKVSIKQTKFLLFVPCCVQPTTAKARSASAGFSLSVWVRFVCVCLFLCRLFALR